jgi:hypothetical protein
VSSTETEENVQTQADQLKALSPEQLKELHQQYSDAGNETAANAIQAVIDEREKLDAKAEKAKAKGEKKAAKSRKGNRAPKGRQVEAAKSFNNDPDQLARLKVILEGDPNHDPPIQPVIKGDGTYQMTEWLIQLGISGYYDERRREGVQGEPAKGAEAPIIPDVTAETVESSEAPTEAEAPEAAAAPAVEEDPLPADDLEPQASAGFPQNPYGAEGDDSTNDE